MTPSAEPYTTAFNKGSEDEPEVKVKVRIQLTMSPLFILSHLLLTQTQGGKIIPHLIQKTLGFVKVNLLRVTHFNNCEAKN